MILIQSKIEMKPIFPFNGIYFAILGDNLTNVCEKVKEFDISHIILQFEEDIDQVTDVEIKLFRQQCNCLPSCILITYEAEIHREQYRTKSGLENDE